jgi:hypothetical protein
MRKIILLAGFFYCITLLQSKAQIYFGLNDGANFTTLSTVALEKDRWESGIGFRAGGFSEVPFGKFGLHLEADYSFVGISGLFDDHVTLHYASLPLNLYYQPIKRLKILAGSEFNFLLAQDGPTYQPSYGADAFKKFEYGIHAELEFLVTQQLGISLRNYFGLQSSGSDDPTQPQRLNGPYKLNILSLGVNYYLTRS